MDDHAQSSYGGKRILQAMHYAVRHSAAIFSEILAAMPPGASRVLDFGAGDAAFADRFRACGARVDCVEPDLQLRALLQAKSINTFSDIAEIDAAVFDFVYTINVLEHIIDVDRSCRELYRVIKPNGRLFVFVPAFEILWTSLDDEVGHVRRFTRKTLRTALDRAGFVIERIKFYDSLGFAALLGVRLLEKLLIFRYDSGSIGVYDTYLLPVSHRLDRLSKNIVGKNLIALARKPGG
jgi:SAM-dependent methyltransferase